MKTQDARWMRIRDLFEHAIELAPQDRDAFVDSSCGDDHVLRDELKSLLAADIGQNQSPLTGAIGAAVESSTHDRRQELLGTVIGPYRLTGVLGHGGAGTVYLGERIDRQYSAQVAVKIVEGAALHTEISRRFRSERQILANLNHPYIARLIDAGETPQGYPYLVMEYVHGEPIDRYCDRLELSLDKRLELILKVCAAVQYAHQNLIVHRDLKPGNILVTPDGTPKLLDFGIAKLLDTTAEAAELALTRMNDRVLTPEYASPEQILGQPITTSSDVYALGIVTYEILTGLRPYKVSSASQLEMERTICVIDATKPSVAVKQALLLASAQPPPTRNIHTIADARNITPMRLRSYLDGDLDAILLRALRKEPFHRYNSIEQFATDVRRYLAREPVMARQGNWLYYTQRFTRRNALGVSAGALFVMLLAGTAINYSIQSKRIAAQRDIATREKQTSDAVANFMTEVFAAADPFITQGKEATATSLLEKSTRSIQEDLSQEPAVKARLLEAMGVTYSRQLQSDKATALIEEALVIRRKLEGEDNPALAPTLINLGKARLNRGDFIDAEKPLNTALQMLEQTKQTRTADYAQVLIRLAELEVQRGNPQLAIKYYERALPLKREIYGPKHPETALALMGLTVGLQWRGDHAESDPYAREAVEIYRATRPELDPDRLSAESLLGASLLRSGRADQAMLLIEDTYAKQVQVFGSQTTRALPEMQLLIEIYQIQRNFVKAEKMARNILEIVRKNSGEGVYKTAHAEITLAIVLWHRGLLREAEKGLRKAIDTYRETLPPEHLFIASAQHYLAEVLLALKKPNDAIAQLTVTLAHLKNANAIRWRIARSENTLGQAYFVLRDFNKAEALLESSYQTLSENNVNVMTFRLAYDRLEQFYATRGNSEKLAALHAQARKKTVLSLP